MAVGHHGHHYVSYHAFVTGTLDCVLGTRTAALELDVDNHTTMRTPTVANLARETSHRSSLRHIGRT